MQFSFRKPHRKPQERDAPGVLKKGWGQSKADTQQASKKCLLGIKQFFVLSREKRKYPPSPKKQINKTNNNNDTSNKKGLGPSEVARPTLPDP